MFESVKKFSVKTIEVAGLGAALQALRLPFKGEPCSPMDINISCEGNEFTLTESVSPGSNDIRLLSSLVKNGDDHSKVLRGVVVYADIYAPRYLWQEFATYRVGTEVLSSESTMHVECKGLSEDDLVALKESLEEGLMQRRIVMFSYQTLRRIYFQRRNHRLPQWRAFCAWIATLPFAKEFITIEK